MAFLPLLETSGECSDYILASIKHLGLRRCGQGPSLLALLGQALTAMAQCSPSSCQAGTQPQWDTPCCPFWNLSCKSVCCLLPTWLLKLTASKILTVGVRSQTLGWCFPCCCTRSAKNTMLTLQRQGNSEIAVSSFMFCFFSWRVLKCLSYLVK